VVANKDPNSGPDVLADLSRGWPFKDEVFDMVVSTWAIEHLISPDQFFREAWRVLAECGSVLVAVPFLHRIHGSPQDYWRFTEVALDQLAQAAGFRHTVVTPVGGTPFLAVTGLLWPLLRPRAVAIGLTILI